LYGHSFGAVVAFEVSLRLQAAAKPPIALVVGAWPAPHVPSPQPPIHALDDGAFIHAIHVRYATPLALFQDRDLMELALPPLRSDMTALETFAHVAGSVLDVPVTALRGTRDRASDAEMIRAWQEVTARPLVVHEIDAGHFFVDTHRAWVQERVTQAILASA
jgi:medium-chain acyl-[acyl-carrier-protein] hydrolase